MIVAEIKEKESWNNFVSSQKHSQFLQSWEWGELRKQEDQDILRLAVADDNSAIQAVCFLIIHKLPLNLSYFYSPRGPIIKDGLNKESEKSAWETLIKEVENIFESRGAIFWRAEPIKLPTEDFLSKQSIVFNIGLSSQSTQPKSTIILDLTKDENDLFSCIDKKTRYDIRIAQEKGVKIKIINNPCDSELDLFWNLFLETTARNAFKPHFKQHYVNVLKFLTTKLFLAEYQEKVIAASIIVYFGDSVFYLFSASSDKYREARPSHLIQWEVIKDAKNNGFKFYDFWGIAPTIAKTKEDLKIQKTWADFTRFKRRFGGKEMNFPGAFDIIFNAPKYKLFRMLQYANRLLKR